MTKKPKYLNFLAGGILAAALSIPLQLMLMYGNPPTEISAIAAKLSPLIWLLLLFCPVVAVLVYRASRLLLIALPALAALVVYNNWFVSRVSNEYPVWLTVLGSLVTCVAFGCLFSGDVRKLLLKPELRWWLTPQRKAAEVTLRLRVLSGRFKSGRDEFYTITFDISEDGAFIPFGREKSTVRELRPQREPADLVKAPPGFNLRHLVPGTQCYLCMSFKELAFVQCRAEVVRVNQTMGRYPGGVGVKFLGLSAREKRLIAHFMEDMDGGDVNVQKMKVKGTTGQKQVA